MSNFLNAANKLKSYSVKIGSVDLIPETIISLEISHSNKDVIVPGTLVIDDLYDIALLEDLNVIDVEVVYTDIYDKTFEKTFVILKISEFETSKNTKMLSIDLQDKFSYTLETSFYSKSFTGTAIDALKSYLEHLQLKEVLINDLTSIEEVVQFTIPQDQNNLISLQNEFRKLGCYFFQNRDSIVIKKLSEMDFSTLPLNGLYIQQTDNQLYKNIIHDIYVDQANKTNTPPKSRSLAFDIKSKKMVYMETGDPKLYKIDSNNDNYLQSENGQVDVYQTTLNFDQNEYNIREKFVSQNSCIIAVNGYIDNGVNQIYDLRIAGNKSSSKLIADGDLNLNGKWVSTKVVDKIVGDSLVQKITLNRSDKIGKK